MIISSITLRGLRGFATQQTLHLAQPNGGAASGLTILVGPNNAGKSTVVEAFRAFSSSQVPSFTEGKRNRTAGDRVSLVIRQPNGSETELRTVASGGSETEWAPHFSDHRILALPSRRHFNPYFGRSAWQREQYASHMAGSAARGALLEGFSYRLFEIQRNRAGFDQVLQKVINPVPDWAIDQADSGQYYLKFTSGALAHSSEGLGEGLVSLLILVDALYDSRDGDVIVVDEPELSLHPAFQRRVAALLAEYAATRQVVVATHSPYFLDLGALEHGARVARVHLGADGSRVSQLSIDTAGRLVRLLRDTRNPHVLGLDAREAFFLDDGIILVEGQDDVVHYGEIARQLGVTLHASFFGWGVGGADKMPLIAKTLSELGFQRVAGVLDSDRAHRCGELSEQFPSYRFASIPAPDVRTKEPRPSTDGVVGLLDEDGVIRPEFATATRDLLTALSTHISRAQGAVA